MVDDGLRTWSSNVASNSRTSSGHKQRALELREPALNIIRKYGKWADYGETRLLEALHAGFRIAYRTRFNTYDVPAAFKVELARVGVRPPKFLPYGLDIWANYRCMHLA